MKRLLHELTKIGIDHADESSIRLQLRRRSDCKTTANQYFLIKGSTSKRIDRRNTDTKNTSCVIIPRCDVPEKFFHLIEGCIILLIHQFVSNYYFHNTEREEEQIHEGPNAINLSCAGEQDYYLD